MLALNCLMDPRMSPQLNSVSLTSKSKESDIVSKVLLMARYLLEPKDWARKMSKEGEVVPGTWVVIWARPRGARDR